MAGRCEDYNIKRAWAGKRHLRNPDSCYLRQRKAAHVTHLKGCSRDVGWKSGEQIGCFCWTEVCLSGRIIRWNLNYPRPRGWIGPTHNQEGAANQPPLHTSGFTAADVSRDRSRGRRRSGSNTKGGRGNWCFEDNPHLPLLSFWHGAELDKAIQRQSKVQCSGNSVRHVCNSRPLQSYKQALHSILIFTVEIHRISKGERAARGVLPLYVCLLWYTPAPAANLAFCRNGGFHLQSTVRFIVYPDWV